MNATDRLRAEFEALLNRLRPALKEHAAEVAIYATAQTEKLALLVGDPGFDFAVIGARDAILLNTAIKTVQAGDLADTVLRDSLLTGLRIGAQMLTAAAA